MPPAHSDHLNTAYPPPLQSAEQAAIQERRRQHDTDPHAPLVGVALSSGGIRSATFCLGLFQALARQKLIRRIDFLSTVSGGGYFGSFLGAAFCRDRENAQTIEHELADNHSWSVEWLRDNGRFLSPNGGGDTWLTAAVALRNWVALHIVLLTFGFLLLGLGVTVRVDLCTALTTKDLWWRYETILWAHHVLHIWWSPWVLLSVFPLVGIMLPTGTIYWLTQMTPLMGLVRRLTGLFRPAVHTWTDLEFAGRAQVALTRGFMVGLVSMVMLFAFGLVDSLGQTAYWHWSAQHFAFPSLWAALTGLGAGAYGLATKVLVFIQELLGNKKVKITLNMVALGLALLWLLLIVVGLSVVACGFAWQWDPVWDGSHLHLMTGGCTLTVAVALSFIFSWWFSWSFGFVNLSSLQQVYAARLRRAYIGATNPRRRKQKNYSMTDLIPGDDLAIEEYQPHKHGGPLHLINVTVNETLSGKTQIERHDRKGLAMAIGPCGLSVGTNAHALWAAEAERPARLLSLQALWEERTRPITPVTLGRKNQFHALMADRRGSTPLSDKSPPPAQKIEALSLGRWTAISGAALTTGLGARTELGLSLLFGLANVRLGYWWNCGINPGQRRSPTSPTFIELGSRILSRILPVQTCLMNEFFARFHGPTRRFWYLSDGGHFENTACYELIRRRVPFIICSDAGQDQEYQFADLANLVRKARTDFGAEIQVIRRASELHKDDPDTLHPLPTLEQLVHPSLLEAIGSPEDFPALHEADDDGSAAPAFARRHAILARIHYVDTDEFSWLLWIKPSLMGDEPVDVVQYQRTHTLFPQEPTSDQYFDEAQWESYRKLGEHIGAELFTPPAHPGTGWSPSQFCPPRVSAQPASSILSTEKSPPPSASVASSN